MNELELHAKLDKIDKKLIFIKVYVVLTHILIIVGFTMVIFGQR